MRHNDSFKRILLGALGGLAGTVAIGVVRSLSDKLMPAATPPIEDDPGEFLFDKAASLLPTRVNRHISQAIEQTAVKSLAFGYGMTFGALYGSLRRAPHRAALDGTVLGLATWAVGYLGWLPVTGLMPPVWRQRAAQAIMPALQHALYGVATVAACDWLSGRAVKIGPNRLGGTTRRMTHQPLKQIKRLAASLNAI